MKNLENRVVLVTGAASGIGRATAREFAREGARLAIADIDEKELANTAAQIQIPGGKKPLAWKTDVSRREEVQKLSEMTLNEFGRIDVLVNNAGVSIGGEIKDMDLSEWERVLGINLWGPIYALHYFLPRMIEQRSGHIVNVSSGAGLFGHPLAGIYTTSKFALVGLSEVLRTELERFGIGVTVVCPGAVKTNIWDRSEMIGFKREIMELAKRVGVSPERVAGKIVRAVKKNQAVLVLDISRFIYGFKRISPGLTRGAFRLALRQMLKQKIK